MAVRQFRWSSVATAVLGIAVVVAFVFVLTRRPPAEAASAVGAGMNDYVGRAAVDFTLAGLDGSTVSLSSLKGHVVVLDFWAMTCPYCVQEMPVTTATAAKFADRGVKYFAVNAAEPPEAVRKFVEAHDWTTPVLLDPDGQTSLRYDVDYLPLLVVIDANGKITARDNVAPEAVGNTLTKWIETALRSGQAK